MKHHRIALALCCLLAYPADMIAARAATSGATENQTPRPETSKPPAKTPEEIAQGRAIAISAEFIALNAFVEKSCPGSKFDPVGAATRLSESKINTDGLDQAKVKELADKQLAFYEGMDAKKACGLIYAEFGPIGSALPDVIVQKK